jgi:hypothetical protein
MGALIFGALILGRTVRFLRREIPLLFSSDILLARYFSSYRCERYTVVVIVQLANRDLGATDDVSSM